MYLLPKEATFLWDWWLLRFLWDNRDGRFIYLITIVFFESAIGNNLLVAWPNLKCLLIWTLLFRNHLSRSIVAKVRITHRTISCIKSSILCNFNTASKQNLSIFIIQLCISILFYHHLFHLLFSKNILYYFILNIIKKILLDIVK